MNNDNSGNEHPTRAFIRMARKLVAAHDEQMQGGNHTPEQALARATFLVKAEEKLDYMFKGGVLAVGGGILLCSGWGPLAVFTGLAMATGGAKIVHKGNLQTRLIDDARQYYTRLGAAGFESFLKLGERNLRLSAGPSAR